MSRVKSSSSPALTVTVCAVFQVPVVKVSDVSLKVTSVLSLARVTVTSPVGSVASCTVKVPDAPSFTVSAVGVRVSPAVSSSSTLTVTVASVHVVVAAAR